MKLANIKVYTDEWLTGTQRTYLEARYEALDRLIEKTYGNLVEMEFSGMSEAAYIHIYNDEDHTKVLHKFSIRNHQNYESSRDTTLWMEDYETWGDLKADLLHQIAKYVNRPEGAENMQHWLYNPITRVLSNDGDGKQYADVYKLAEVQEVKTKDGFAMEGTLADGTPIRAYLSRSDYFMGQQFRV